MLRLTVSDAEIYSSLVCWLFDQQLVRTLRFDRQVLSARL